MRQALVAGWIAFVYLVVGASPSHFWLDSGEIGAAGHGLGVMHPPGVPGYTMLLRAATLVPLGSLGFRMGVLSSLLGALVIVGMFVVLRGRKARAWVTWGAAAWVLAGWTFVRQGRVVEIYAFAAALLLVVLWGFDPGGGSRRRVGRRLCGVFAAVWAAWSFGDLRLALVPLVIVTWLVAIRRGAAWARWAPLCVVLASATLLVLPLASASGPATDWGDPDHATRLVRHLGADSIRDAYGDEILPSSAAMWGHNLNAAFEQLAQDLGPPGPAFAGLALITLWLPIRGRRLPTKVAAAITWLVFVEVFYAVGINPMGVADRQTALVLGPVLALAVAELFRRLLEPNPRLAWGLAPLCWTVLVLPAALTSVGDIVTTRSWAASAWTRAALAQLPPGGLLLTQSDDLAAGSLHAQQIEGARPDVITFPAQHLHKPMSEAVARTPRAARVWGAAAAGTTEAGRIEAAIAAHDGAVALEHAAATLFTSVRFWSPLGRLPLRVDGRGVAPEIASPRSVHQEIDDWLPRMPAEDDKRRLAEAIANHARGVVRMSGDVPAAVTALEASLRRVSARHASGYVTLAALHDRLGHPERAIELTRQALEIEPDRPVALGNLALYLGRDPATRKEAIEIAKRAALLRPWRSEGWLRVAQLAESEGDVEGAKRARQRAEAARTRGAE